MGHDDPDDEEEGADPDDGEGVADEDVGDDTSTTKGPATEFVVMSDALTVSEATLQRAAM